MPLERETISTLCLGFEANLWQAVDKSSGKHLLAPKQLRWSFIQANVKDTDIGRGIGAITETVDPKNGNMHLTIPVMATAKPKQMNWAMTTSSAAKVIAIRFLSPVTHGSGSRKTKNSLAIRNCQSEQL